MEIGLARLGAAYEPVSQEICPPPENLAPWAKFPGKYGPRGGATMHCTRSKLFNIHVCKGAKFGPEGPYFGGAKFPGTPASPG